MDKELQELANVLGLGEIKFVENDNGIKTYSLYGGTDKVWKIALHHINDGLLNWIEYNQTNTKITTEITVLRDELLRFGSLPFRTAINLVRQIK